mgnify:CR=1 FL=1
MKPITSKKLKVGDWIRTKPIYDFLIKKGELGGRYYVINVQKIEKTKSKDPKIKRDIYVTTYYIYGEEINKTPVPGEEEYKEIFIMNKEEISEFKKMLILNSLK